MSSSPYAPAATLLNKIWEKKKGIKTLAYSKDGELTVSKSTYAQCCNVLKYQARLDQIVQEFSLEAKNRGLLYVLLYELLFGPNKSIRGGGALKRALIKKEEKLRDYAESITADDDDNAMDESDSAGNIPRYVRINTIIGETDEVVTAIQENTDRIYSDEHVSNLLVLDPTPETRAMLQPLVLENKVILQDKSSCFSALCMVHGFDEALAKDGGDYLDACAAPGNKTSHLASLVKDIPKSTVHALDKSKDRFQMLQRRMKQLAPNVHCHQKDFLSTAQVTFPNVSGILLDPSCSGSGMSAHRISSSEERDPLFTNDRIHMLSKFQFKALCHAMVEFPKVNRIVYSTCSLYAEENEKVVAYALEENPEWKLIRPRCLSTWKRRGMDCDGLLSREQADAMIRVDPTEDETNGFFVACFERRSEASGAKQSKNKVWNPPVIQGVELYSGEFKTVLEGRRGSNETKKSKSPAAQAPKNKADKAVTSKSLKVNSKESKPKAAKKDLSALPKKIAKKLKWKEEQRRKKAERMQKKAAAKGK